MTPERRQELNDALNGIDALRFGTSAEQFVVDHKSLRDQKIDFAKSLTDPEERAFAFYWIARK